MKRIECNDTDCIRLKGSNALIYGFGYHDIFGDVLRSPHYSKYAKAPVMTLLGLDIEILLKGIIMTATGTEPWKGNSKNGHSIKYLFEQIPQPCINHIYKELSLGGFSEDKSKEMISQIDFAFVEFRYNYEKVEQRIDPTHEDFLKKLWTIVYELSLKAQQEYRDNYV